MRAGVNPFPWCALLVVAWIGCDDGETTPPVDAGADVADEDASPFECSGSCVVADFSQAIHAVSPLIFGDNLEWTDYGQHVWDLDTTDPTADNLGRLRADVVDELEALGVRIIRYPAGAQADSFRWETAVGRWDARTALDRNPRDGDPNDLQIPLLGPDELAELTNRIGAQMLITPNIVQGTASEAAAWLQHYLDRGITHARYWEIGNESHFEGSITPEDYASLFDAYAAALRAVDPTVKVGLIACRDTENPIQLCVHAPEWNSVVLGRITEHPNFIAVHNSYAPLAADPPASDDQYQALLSASAFLEDNFAALETDLLACGSRCEGTTIAVTEHAPLFFPDVNLSVAEQIEQLAQNRAAAAALFSALSYQVFLRTSRIELANHFNMMSPVFQAALLPRLFGPGESDDDYAPEPIRTAFFHVFRLYADLTGGELVTSEVQGTATLSADAFGYIPALAGVPALDAIAGTASGSSFLYVVNRDVAESYSATVHVSGTAATSVRVDQLAPDDLRAEDTRADPDAIEVTKNELAASRTFAFEFPAHSLTRFTFSD